MHGKDSYSFGFSPLIGMEFSKGITTMFVLYPAKLAACFNFLRFILHRPCCHEMRTNGLRLCTSISGRQQQVGLQLGLGFPYDMRPVPSTSCALSISELAMNWIHSCIFHMRRAYCETYRNMLPTMPFNHSSLFVEMLLADWLPLNCWNAITALVPNCCWVVAMRCAWLACMACHDFLIRMVYVYAWQWDRNRKRFRVVPRTVSNPNRLGLLDPINPSEIQWPHIFSIASRRIPLNPGVSFWM